MSFPRKRLACAGFLAALPALSFAQEWTEAELVRQFESLSPLARELKARVALTQAEARARTVYPNPSVSYSREGAGYTEFFQASQTLPISGRVRYLREAGNAEVVVAEADRAAFLWSSRSDLRVAFYRMLAAQERESLLAGRFGEIDELIGKLRDREREGEGSHYDRVRAERELVELRADVSAVQSLAAAMGFRLASFLPEGTVIQRVTGQFPDTVDIPTLDDLLTRALAARPDFKVAQRTLARYRAEELAARRLRIPEPTINAGLKRADVTAGSGPNPFSDVTRSGVVFGITIPLPTFNSGQYEVARYQAEQEREQAHLAVLDRQIRTEVQGARQVLAMRKDALESYRKEQAANAGELSQITKVAYEEGEIGILEVLDALRLRRNADLRLLDLKVGVREAFIELDRVVGEEVYP